MLRILGFCTTSLFALANCIGCDAGEVLTVTGLVGGNISLATIIARGLGLPVAV